MLLKFSCDNYLTMNGEDKVFVQKLLFWDYVEEVTQLAHAQGRYLSVLEYFMQDFHEWIDAENYEMAQLYKDTVLRFKTEFQDFG